MSPPHATTEQRPLPWWPALDTLRGLAVIAVLLYHHDAALLPGGFLGVSLFFTLSGFLITSLLLSEHERHGRIDLRRFWARRPRRLVPASCIGILFAVAVIGWTFPAPARGGPLGHAAAAAANVANWFAIGEGTTYGELLGYRSPVEHYWSLAIEEQLYVVLPIVAVVALRRSRRALVVALGMLTAASVGTSLLLHDANREYLGTDVRAAELLIGGLLAIVLHRWRMEPGTRQIRRRHLDLVGAAALLVMLVAWRAVPLSEPALYRGGFAVVGLVSTGLIAAAVAGWRFPRALDIAGLRAVGRISYGVYVVHLPVYVVLDEARTGLDGAALLALRCAVTFALATASWFLVERRVRYGTRLPVPLGRVAYLTAVSSVLVVVVGAYAVGNAGERDVREAALAAFTDEPSALPHDAGGIATTATAGGAAAGDAGSPAPLPSAPTSADVRAGAPARTPVRLVVVGDSTALHNGVGFESWAARTGDAQVRVSANNASTVLTGDAIRLRTGWVQEDLDPTVFARNIDAAADLEPDALVVFIGSLQLADWRLAANATWRHFGQAAYEAAYAAALDAALDRLEARRIPILWADVPVPMWDPSDNPNEAGIGPMTTNDPLRTRQLNTITSDALASRPNARVIPYAAIVAPNGTVPDGDRPDGLHMDPEVIERYLDGELGAALRSAYRAILTDPRATIAIRRLTTWS